MGGPDVMAVRTALVKQVLVVRIADAAQERAAAVELLDGFDSADGSEAALALARAGYAARMVERELFEPARRPMAGLHERVHEAAERLQDRRAAVTEVSRSLAAAEPPGRPDPADGVASWRVPGPGGHVRHYVALDLVDRLSNVADAPARKRDVMFGFFLRCCEEV